MDPEDTSDTLWNVKIQIRLQEFNYRSVYEL